MDSEVGRSWGRDGRCEGRGRQNKQINLSIRYYKWILKILWIRFLQDFSFLFISCTYHHLVNFTSISYGILQFNYKKKSYKKRWILVLSQFSFAFSHWLLPHCGGFRSLPFHRTAGNQLRASRILLYFYITSKFVSTLRQNRQRVSNNPNLVYQALVFMYTCNIKQT